MSNLLQTEAGRVGKGVSGSTCTVVLFVDGMKDCFRSTLESVYSANSVLLSEIFNLPQPGVLQL